MRGAVVRPGKILADRDRGRQDYFKPLNINKLATLLVLKQFYIKYVQNKSRYTHRFSSCSINRAETTCAQSRDIYSYDKNYKTKYKDKPFVFKDLGKTSLNALQKIRRIFKFRPAVAKRRCHYIH